MNIVSDIGNSHLLSHVDKSLLTAGLGFVLHKEAYSNGSTVLRTDIGEGDNALHCITNNTSCCNGAGRAGEFYFPDGTQVPISGNDPTRTYYRNRGDGFIRLNRRPNGKTTGKFRCEIPDANGVLVNLFIIILGNVYNN